MQALMNTQYGAPQVLTLGAAALPKVGPKDILVRVHATSVTQGDRRLRAADYPGLSAFFGRLMTGLSSPRNPIGGTHFAGRVVDIGKDVTQFAVGDDVFGGAMQGAYAQYLSISEQGPVAKMPSSLGYAEAVVLPYGAGTALAFLRDMAQVKPGERVLIVGAAGGVGRMAVQVAKHLGAHVTGVCGDGSDVVRSLGADEIIDYRKQDFTQSAQKWDVIFDTIEGDHFRTYQSVLSPGGRYLSLYFTAKLALQMAFTSLFGGQRPIVGVALPNAKTMREIAQLADQNVLTDPISARFSLSDGAAAHAFLETARPYGSIVIDVVDGRDGVLMGEAGGGSAVAAE